MLSSLDPHVFAFFILMLGLMWLALRAFDGPQSFGCPGCDSKTPGEHAKGCHFKDRDR